jgi:ElaB/YqjD/DUF883 family membrane-anchored ribosome-binding protein
MLIKDILEINLGDDIKNVIDLEDFSEQALMKEIDNYIVTDGLAKEFEDLVNKYCSNISETGVWISGFYGSGKSYFGKLAGYLIGNPKIGGTPARDRILQRFAGVENEDLIRNNIGKLAAYQSRLIFFDSAKQDASKGLAFMMFKNFLKSLDLPENEYGYLLFHVMNDAKLMNVAKLVKTKLGKEWSDIRHNLVEYASVPKDLLLQAGKSEADVESLLDATRRQIDAFDAARLKQELDNYLKIVPEERLVFLFDEASEAINQKKYSPFDLEAISESLTALRSKVWTIAIAQEKLDDVINNANISRATLTKVIDRFKTKIHLEATEVDVIIRSSLLKKNAAGKKALTEHFSKNGGSIADHAGLSAAIPKTDKLDTYLAYYPFYSYQFELLQNFLFGTKGSSSTKVAARGMIITTYDILKEELQKQPLFSTTTGWQITRAAQKNPPVRLVNRFQSAESILKESGSPVSGRTLLETIHFLFEAEIVPTSLENICKSFVANPEALVKQKADIERALEILVDHKILLHTNNIYRITSDIEQRLFDDMGRFQVQGFKKKKWLVDELKRSSFVQSLKSITEAGTAHDFYITTDNDDELHAPANKFLKVKVKSLYSLGDDRNADIESIKLQYQNDKSVLWIVPENDRFQELDKLIAEVERISYIEDKYSNPNSEEAPYIKVFQNLKSEKLAAIKRITEESLVNGTAIYYYNTFQLTPENWLSTLQGQQRSILSNVFDKKLSAQLSDSTALLLIKEQTPARYKQYFQGPEFQFFDNDGNFIGDSLLVVDEITRRIKANFAVADDIYKELSGPPTGYAFGTVMTTMAVLLKAGKVIMKVNGAEKYSWKDAGVQEVFGNARMFRSAAFKSITKALKAADRQQIAKLLLDMEVNEHTKLNVTFNSNDMELAKAVHELAKRFVNMVEDLRRTVSDFDRLFSTVESEKQKLLAFTSPISDANYIDVATNFLESAEPYQHALDTILKTQRFVQTNLTKVRQWEHFASAVQDELSKASTPNAVIQTHFEEFKRLCATDVQKHFGQLQQKIQKIKDEYHRLFSEKARESAQQYRNLLTQAESVIRDIQSLPASLNRKQLQDAISLKEYAEARTGDVVELEFETKDKNSRFTYSEVISFCELFPTKVSSLEYLAATLVREEPAPIPVPTPGDPLPPTPPTPRQVIRTKAPARKLKVGEYRLWLKTELQKLASSADNDEIEISND